jgi:hypothetical protein
MYVPLDEICWYSGRTGAGPWSAGRKLGSVPPDGRRAVQGKVARRSRGGRRPRRRTDAQAALARYQADAEGGGPEAQGGAGTVPG